MHGALPWYEPGTLAPDQAVLYDRIARGPRATGPRAFDLVDAAGRLEGPFNALLAAPAVGTAVADLGSAIRFESGLPARAREIAILAVAVERRCEFEWYAHERIGSAIGLSRAELDRLLAGEAAPSFDAYEVLVHTCVGALVRDRDFTDSMLGRARAELGDGTVMEMIALVGYYDLLATSLRVWRTPLPAGVETIFEGVEDVSPALGLARAQTIVAVAHRHGRENGRLPLAVAVLDARAALVAYGAQDETSVGRGPIALAKASGALAMGFGSRAIAARAKKNPQFYASLVTALPGGLVPAPGGVLIRLGSGRLVGAVGISGDLADGDEAAAIAGIEAAGFRADPGDE